MLKTPGLTRWATILGIGLLAITLVAATQLLPDATPVAGQIAGKSPPGAPPAVYCTGKVDVDPGVQRLLPQQVGIVDEVYVKDGVKIKAGTPILKVKDDAFVAKEAQAMVAIEIAESKVAQARQAIAQHDEQIKGLEAAVAAAQQLVVIAEQNITYINRQIANESKEKPALADDLVKAKADKVARDETVKGRQAELQAAKNGKPIHLVTAAEKNVDLERAKLKEAKEARSRCTLVAPVDGRVLRNDAPKGTMITLQAHDVAVLFAPDGEWFVRLEVEQEYAHRIPLQAGAVISDESNQLLTWPGEVVRIGEAFLPPRPGAGAQILATTPDTAKLEVIVKFKNVAANDPRIRLGQKMSVAIGTPGK